MNNEEKKSMGAHNLILEERGSLTVTGVDYHRLIIKAVDVLHTGHRQ